ncbi:hypothetical protein GCM10022247_50740 [Allokutzneria multivorans]|uniref:Uncharacterized protein n=1 Tax=Allokutzneria multivorans TaxID=1142134 RepID=A0ABP7T433_9PSEU
MDDYGGGRKAVFDRRLFTLSEIARSEQRGAILGKPGGADTSKIKNRAGECAWTPFVT